MKFAHLADCHIGGWREDKLRELSIETFRRAIDICIEKNTAFILIAGDLFNTALPNIELLKETASILRKAKDNDIDIYIIPGSHDFSTSGKTMIDVLEKAGLLENVMKFKDNKLQFTTDKTNVKITGLLGKKGGLEITDYENLDKKHLEKESGFKIFMFHTALTEFKPKDLEKMDSMPVASLPKNFNYYAGGHPHYIFNKKHEKGLLTYPGALFPNNFKELEEFKNGGFYIVDDKLNLEYIPIKIKEINSYLINANDKTPEEVEREILSNIKDFNDKILTLKIEGTLKTGKPSDIKFKDIFSKFKDAFIILKNTNKLTTKEFEELKLETGNVEDIEKNIIEKHLQQIKIKNLTKKQEEKLVHDLIDALDKEKHEGEKNVDFENRLIKDLLKVLDLEKIWK
jgi:hypothetical protein